MKDFFKKHPLINPESFLVDAAFDSIKIYKYLVQETSIEKHTFPKITNSGLKGLTIW